MNFETHCNFFTYDQSLPKYFMLQLLKILQDKEANIYPSRMLLSVV